MNRTTKNRSSNSFKVSQTGTEQFLNDITVNLKQTKNNIEKTLWLFYKSSYLQGNWPFIFFWWSCQFVCNYTCKEKQKSSHQKKKAILSEY